MKRPFAKIIAAAVLCAATAAHPKPTPTPPPKAVAPAPKADAFKRIEAILPTGWVVEENEPSIPLMWRGSKDCRHFTMTNPTKILSEQERNFDYNPFHDLWLCPVEFWGKMEKADPADAKIAARYVADGDDGILFAVSLGSPDWRDPAGSAADALGMTKPAYDSVECDKLTAAISGKVYMPEIVLLECRSNTRDGIFLSLSTDANMREIEIDKLTGLVIDAVKKADPYKKRVMVGRSYGHMVDSILSAYIAVF